MQEKGKDRNETVTKCTFYRGRLQGIWQGFLIGFLIGKVSIGSILVAGGSASAARRKEEKNQYNVLSPPQFLATIAYRKAAARGSANAVERLKMMGGEG